MARSSNASPTQSGSFTTDELVLASTAHNMGERNDDSISLKASNMTTDMARSSTSPYLGENGINRGSSLPHPTKLPRRDIITSQDSPVTISKKSSLKTFFTVREPSSLAFDEYQESMMRHQKRSASSKPSGVGLAMVSSAKMPADVPKVNSKWEGVPNSMIRKKKKKKSDSFSHTLKSTPSLMSHASSQATSIHSQGSRGSKDSKDSLASSRNIPHSQPNLPAWPQAGCKWATGTMAPHSSLPSAPRSAAPLKTPVHSSSHFLTIPRNLPTDLIERNLPEITLSKTRSRQRPTNTAPPVSVDKPNWPLSTNPFSQQSSGSVPISRKHGISRDLQTLNHQSLHSEATRDTTLVEIQNSGPRILPPPTSSCQYKSRNSKSHSCSLSDEVFPRSILKTSDSRIRSKSDLPCRSPISAYSTNLNHQEPTLSGRLDSPVSELSNRPPTEPNYTTNAWGPGGQHGTKKKRSIINKLFRT